VIVFNISVQEQPDTISINKRNENLFPNARRNPDMVIPIVRQILHESEKINYLRGKADASLTLAWHGSQNTSTGRQCTVLLYAGL